MGFQYDRCSNKHLTPRVFSSKNPTDVQSHSTLLFFIHLAVPRGLWDLSSLTRDRTCAPCSGSSNNLTSSEVPHCTFTLSPPPPVRRSTRPAGLPVPSVSLLLALKKRTPFRNALCLEFFFQPELGLPRQSCNRSCKTGLWGVMDAVQPVPQLQHRQAPLLRNARESQPLWISWAKGAPLGLPGRSSGLGALDLALPSFACRERRYSHMTPLSPGS